MIFFLLLACYTEESFRDDLDDATCRWKSDCYQEDFQDCLRAALEARTASPPNCSFLPESGHACVNGVEEMECKEDAARSEIGFPEACQEVWNCD